MRCGVNLAINKLSDYTFMEYFVACASRRYTTTLYNCRVFFEVLHVYGVFAIPSF